MERALSIAEERVTGALGVYVAEVKAHQVTIEIGGMPILLRTDSPEFAEVLENRYGGFVNPEAQPIFAFDVEIAPPGRVTYEKELRVSAAEGRWVIERGDFHAECDLASGKGRIRQPANLYSIEAALRILHSLLLALRGGLLVHAASAVRHGDAYLFAGVSGAGKTTITRLAPPDATLLTDEISYLRREGSGYVAYGTPFAGELGEPGRNVRAPLAGLFLLEHGAENRVVPVEKAEAVRGLMRHVLFFARDETLVKMVFQTVCDFVKNVPVRRLIFTPDQRVWELVRDDPAGARPRRPFGRPVRFDL